MRRLIHYWRPLPIEIVGGMPREGYSEQQSAFLSMQPVDGGGSFRAYLTGRKPQDYMEAIGETMELLADPKAMAAIRKHREGRAVYHDVSVLDKI